MRDVVGKFDKNYNKILNDSECQPSSVANDPKSSLAPVMFSLNDLDIATNKLVHGKGFDHVHSLNFKLAQSIFGNLVCKYMNKILSHTNIPPVMLKGRIRPTVNSTSDTKTDSQN